MRDKHYPIKGYRIDPKTIEKKLANLKTETGLSYNLLFKLLIETYEQTKRNQI